MTPGDYSRNQVDTTKRTRAVPVHSLDSDVQRLITESQWTATVESIVTGGSGPFGTVAPLSGTGNSNKRGEWDHTL